MITHLIIWEREREKKTHISKEFGLWNETAKIFVFPAEGLLARRWWLPSVKYLNIYLFHIFLVARLRGRGGGTIPKCPSVRLLFAPMRHRCLLPSSTLSISLGFFAVGVVHLYKHAKLLRVPIESGGGGASIGRERSIWRLSLPSKTITKGGRPFVNMWWKKVQDPSISFLYDPSRYFACQKRKGHSRTSIFDWRKLYLCFLMGFSSFFSFA